MIFYHNLLEMKKSGNIDLNSDIASLIPTNDIKYVKDLKLSVDQQ